MAGCRTLYHWQPGVFPSSLHCACAMPSLGEGGGIYGNLHRRVWLHVGNTADPTGSTCSVEAPAATKQEARKRTYWLPGVDSMVFLKLKSPTGTQALGGT
jgi:hypothetical protein